MLHMLQSRNPQQNVENHRGTITNNVLRNDFSGTKRSKLPDLVKFQSWSKLQDVAHVAIVQTATKLLPIRYWVPVWRLRSSQISILSDFAKCCTCCNRAIRNKLWQITLYMSLLDSAPSNSMEELQKRRKRDIFTTDAIASARTTNSLATMRHLVHRTHHRYIFTQLGGIAVRTPCERASAAARVKTCNFEHWPNHDLAWPCVTF